MSGVVARDGGVSCRCTTGRCGGPRRRVGRCAKVAEGEGCPGAAVGGVVFSGLEDEGAADVVVVATSLAWS